MKKVLVLFFVFKTIVVLAQEASAIVTDRPTQSAAATVTPKGNFLIEYGFISEKATSNILGLTHANVLIKYGILNGVELRVTQNYQGVKNKALDELETGLSPLILGTKIHLIEASGAIPLVSVIGQVTLANGDEIFKPTSSIPEIRLNFANALSDKLSLGYNFGFSFPEDNTTTFYTAVLGYALVDGWTVFAESYGFFYEGASDHRFNTGVIYLAKKNLQFDVSAGWGLSEVSPDSFVGFGAAIGF